jgi:hypothetical protein
MNKRSPLEFKALKRCLAVLLAALLLCGCFAVAASAATDITADFTDQNFRAAVYEIIGKTAPAPIYDTDVAGILSLNVYERGIQTLAGIEHFTALESLRCNNNQLTALDVSKNTALYQLACGNNQLTALDVSKNPALESLRCDNNQLTALDVSKNTALESLYCPYNQLPALDVSKNTALRFLGCDNNQLTALDVSKNPALEALNCSYNNMQSKADVIGFTGVWDNENFIFDPQRTGNPAVAKAALEATIAEYANLKESDYTAETWAAYKAALEKAKQVAADPDATQQQVDDALAKLNAAKTALQPAPADDTKYIQKHGQNTKYKSNFINWILLIFCFGWLWM